LGGSGQLGVSAGLPRLDAGSTERGLLVDFSNFDRYGLGGGSLDRLAEALVLLLFCLGQLIAQGRDCAG